ncbi:MAG: DUF4625 domain-containing protein [Bacteroidota bacterium]
MNRIFSVILLSGVVLATGCKKKLDIAPPDVVYMNINGASEDIVLTAGNNYSFFYQIEDNSGVDYVNIKVQKGFNFETNPEKTAADFFLSNGFDYDQKVKTEGISFNPPSNVSAGSYRVSVKPSDNNDNNNVERFLDFIVVNGTEPKMTDFGFSSTTDSLSEVVSARRGDNLVFYGKAESGTDIAKVKIEFLNATKSLLYKEIPFSGTTDFAVDLKQISDSLKITVDPIWGRGDYKVVVHVIDSNGQAAVKIFKMKVVY